MDYNPDNHLDQIHEAAVQCAARFANRYDFTRPEHYDQLAEQSYAMGDALVKQYYKRVEEANVRAAAEERKQFDENKRIEAEIARRKAQAEAEVTHA